MAHLPPLLGYNTNVRHKDNVFHIQTEDSGLAHGHIFTHLFADGGRIVASKKTTYKELIDTEHYPHRVKKLMQAQHKAMFSALREGYFDEDEMAGAARITAMVFDPFNLPEKVSEKTVETPSQELSSGAASLDELPTQIKSAELKSAELRSAERKAPSEAPTRDIAAFEAAAAKHLARRPSGTMVAPTTFVGENGQLSVSPKNPSSAPAEEMARTAGSTRTVRSSIPPQPSETFHINPASSRPRSAPQRPSVQQAKTAKANANASLFGQKLVSERSLDEVIMSYLAEDDSD